MIDIISAELIDDQWGRRWYCWLQLTQGPDSWMLPATAPGTLALADLQAHFDAQEADLWRVAQEKRYPVDVWERIPEKRLLKAFALVVLDDSNRQTQKINQLCQIAGIAGLQERTPDQIVAAIKAKLK